MAIVVEIGEGRVVVVEDGVKVQTLDGQLWVSNGEDWVAVFKEWSAAYLTKRSGWSAS